MAKKYGRLGGKRAFFKKNDSGKTLGSFTLLFINKKNITLRTDPFIPVKLIIP